MSFAPVNFGFDLNNREISVLIYTIFFLLYVLIYNKTQSKTLELIREFFMPVLLKIWILMSLYVATCVWLLAWLNFWEWTNLKSTLLWWLTVGFTSIFEAQQLMEKPNRLSKMVRDSFTLSTIVLFVVELASFPIWIEIIMFPSLVFLGLLIATGELQTGKPGFTEALNLLRGLQKLIGLIILLFSFWLVATHVAEFWSLNTLREFGLPLMLWIMFVPFIFTLAIYMIYQEAFIGLQMRPKQNPIVNYARWRALFAFGWNIDGVKRLARDIRGRDISNKKDVNEAIREIQRLLKVEKNPSDVPRVEGWSPHKARLFLEDYGLITDDYHRTLWEWFAQVPLVKLNDSLRADRISYYLCGHERAVTQLRLALNGSNQNDPVEAQRAFDERALALIIKAVDAERAMTIYTHAQASEPEAVVVDGVRVTLDRSAWGDERHGGYDRNLTIQHPTHQKDS